MLPLQQLPRSTPSPTPPMVPLRALARSGRRGPWAQAARLRQAGTAWAARNAPQAAAGWGAAVAASVHDPAQLCSSSGSSSSSGGSAAARRSLAPGEVHLWWLRPAQVRCLLCTLSSDATLPGGLDLQAGPAPTGPPSPVSKPKAGRPPAVHAAGRGVGRSAGASSCAADAARAAALPLGGCARGGAGTPAGAGAGALGAGRVCGRGAGPGGAALRAQRKRQARAALAALHAGRAPPALQPHPHRQHHRWGWGRMGWGGALAGRGSPRIPSSTS